MSDDTLIGGPGDDTIDGGQGNDRLAGLADNDSILGGTGNDYLYGDGGDDVLRGGAGYDLLAGGTGKDTLEGGDGGDYIYGGEGRDIAIYTGNKADYLWQRQVTTDANGNVIDSYWSVYNTLTYENDSLRDVEVLRFDDGDVVIVPPPTTLKRVSLDATGLEQSQPSLQPLAWSADGTEVAFRSDADLLGNGTAYTGRIYAKNVDTGAVRALDEFINSNVQAVSPDLTHLYYQDSLSGNVSVGPVDGSSASVIQGGTYTDPNSSEWTVNPPYLDVLLANGGARIAYRATIYNYNQTNFNYTYAERWVIREVASGNVLFVENAAGLPASGSGIYQSSYVYQVAIAADGDTAVFATPDGTGIGSDITVWDVNNGSLLQTISGVSYLNQIDISADGGTIAFVAYDPASFTTSAFVSSVGGSPAVAVRDQWGNPLNVNSIDLSADGSVLAYTSTDYSGITNVYLLELATGPSMLASTDGAGGVGNGSSGLPLLSPDGQRLAFQSDAANLDPIDTNGNTDIFVFDTRVIGDPLPTITGTDDPVLGDVLYGIPSPPFADVVAALRGDDYVDTGEGNDLVIAGLGNDTVYGGDGNDELRGEGGDDYLSGDDGDDMLLGGDESDTLYGGVGNDKLYGGDSRTIYGGNTYSFGANYLYGGDGNDELYGGGGVDNLYPGPGDDIVDGGVVDYQASDSHGNTLYYDYGYANNAGGVYVNLTSGTAIDPDGGHDTLSNIHVVFGTANADTLIGNDNQYGYYYTYLLGGGGDDLLVGGGGGFHYMDGGDGDDTLEAGDGGGILIGGSGSDVLKGGAGFDYAYLPTYSPFPGAGFSFTLLEPGTGLIYQLVSDGAGGTDQLFDNIEGLFGSYYTDVLTGNSAANYLYGLSGDDTITGGAGNDTINGNDGTDTAVYAGNIAGYQITNVYSYVYQNIGYAQWEVQDIDLSDGNDGTDSIWASSDGQGTELLKFADGNFVITASPGGTSGGDLLYGGSNPDTLDGGLGNDQTYAGGGDDSVHGGEGDDTLYGQAGNDFLEGDNGDDVIYGGVGNDMIIGDSGLGDDQLYGEEGDDTIIGHAGNDLLNGGAGNDSLDGGEDDDLLIGGAGSDTLVGGNGNDTAVFSGVNNGYLVELLADGRTQVTDIDTSNGDDGTDILEGVETLQFAPDLISPTAAISLDDTYLTIGETATVTISFSEAVNGFELSDLSASSGILSNLIAGDGNSYTATFTPTPEINVSDNVISLAAGAYSDLAGNQGAAASSSIYTVNVVCFLAGTLIATPTGERPIETLKPGDLITTTEGPQPVRFLARSTRSIAQLQALGKMPIHINQGAFGSLGPAQDTFMSPSHAIHFAGSLVEAGAMINGTSVQQLNDWPDSALTYYNIELERHGLITANGLLVESYFANYRSNGFSRDCWDNYHDYVALYGASELMEELPLPRIAFARQIPMQLRLTLQLHEDNFKLTKPTITESGVDQFAGLCL